MNRADPKHGRWILPLVIAGLIGFTYLFVTALPPGSNDAGANGTGVTTTITPENGTGDDGANNGTTPPTEAPPAFVATIDNVAATGAELAEEAQSINTEWEGEENDFVTTRDALVDLQNRTATFATEVAEADVPPEATEAWATVTAAAEEMSVAAAGMVTGLVDSPGPEDRRNALEAYTSAAADVASGLNLSRTAVGG